MEQIKHKEFLLKYWFEDDTFKGVLLKNNEIIGNYSAKDKEVYLKFFKKQNKNNYKSKVSSYKYEYIYLSYEKFIEKFEGYNICYLHDRKKQIKYSYFIEIISKYGYFGFNKIGEKLLQTDLK